MTGLNELRFLLPRTSTILIDLGAGAFDLIARSKRNAYGRGWRLHRLSAIHADAASENLGQFLGVVMKYYDLG